MGSFYAEGSSSFEVTYEHLFYFEVVRTTKEAEYYLNGKKVNQPTTQVSRRIVFRWGRILTTSAIVAVLILAITR